jgi:hypothetical protein
VSTAGHGAAVSAVVKATVLDTAYLAATVPHMLAQARYPFVERVVVVDERPEFAGRFRGRAASTRAALDEVLSSLLREGAIDRVAAVPSHAGDVAALMARYFGGDEAERIPTVSIDGCAIAATLFALETAATDRAVQFDADMLFHAADTSWVAEGLAPLDDPSVWLVMTHGGPPSGPIGTRRSLGPGNERGVAWDETHRAWSFSWASTRYFLTDRTRLRGRVAPLWEKGELLPLEVCLSASLERAGARRLNLARRGSWDLHAYHHGAPFPEWAARIAWLVEQGIVPARQRGQFDLRLDLPQTQRDWQPLVLDAERFAFRRGRPLGISGLVDTRTTR